MTGEAGYPVSYNNPMSVFGNVAKWLGAPLGCAAIGYFIIGPRLSHKVVPARPKPSREVAQVLTPAEEPKPVVTKKPIKAKTPPLEETAVATEAPVAADKEPGKEPGASVVDPSEKPVLEVTTESEKPHQNEPARKPRMKKHKRKPSPDAVVDPASNADPASTAAPASGPEEPKPTEPPATPEN